MYNPVIVIIATVGQLGLAKLKSQQKRDLAPVLPTMQLLPVSSEVFV